MYSKDLEKAVRSNDMDAARHLLLQGASVNAQNSKGSTVLMDAVWNGNLPMVELLCDSNADPNIANLRRNTALHFAYEKEHTDIAIYIEAHSDLRPSVNGLGRVVGAKAQKTGMSEQAVAMQRAMEANTQASSASSHMGMARTRVHAHAHVHDTHIYMTRTCTRTRTRLYSPLYVETHGPCWLGGFAVQARTGTKFSSILMSLIETDDEPGVAAFLATVQAEAMKKWPKSLVDREDYVSAILDAPAKRTKGTVLMAAVQGSTQGIARLLLENGADPNLQNLRGDTALHFAMRQSNDGTMRSAPAPGVGSDGSPLNSPRPTGTSMVDLLLKFQADGDIRNRMGMTPNDVKARIQRKRKKARAVESHFDDKLADMINEGDVASVKVRLQDLRTQYCAEDWDIPPVVNAQNNVGLTLLMIATFDAQVSVVLLPLHRSPVSLCLLGRLSLCVVIIAVDVASVPVLCSLASFAQTLSLHCVDCAVPVGGHATARRRQDGSQRQRQKRRDCSAHRARDAGHGSCGTS